MAKTISTIPGSPGDIITKLKELDVPLADLNLIRNRILPEEQDYNTAVDLPYSKLTLSTSEKLLNLYKADNKAFDLSYMCLIMNTDARTKDGDTILHLAAQNEITSLLGSAILYLLNKPADKNNTGATPVHLAAANGKTEAISILHKQGAALDAQDNTGATPLHLAAFTRQNKALETLLQLKPDLIDIPDKRGDTALMIAVYKGDITTVKTLAKFTHNIDSPNLHGVTSCMMVALRRNSDNDTNTAATLRTLSATANATQQENITVATIPKNQDFNQPIPESAQAIPESSPINVKSQVKVSY